MVSCIESFFPSSHSNFIHAVSHSTLWKISIIAGAFFCGHLCFLGGPAVGLVSAVVVLGIEGAVALKNRFLNNHTKSGDSPTILKTEKASVQTSQTIKDISIMAITEKTQSVSIQDQIIEFFKKSPNFSTYPHFEKFIRDRVHLPDGSHIKIDGNILTIQLDQKAMVHIDPEESLTESEFLKMNRHTETDNLLPLGDKCVNPLPQNLPPLKIKSLYYMRSFGEIITAMLQRQKQIPLGPKIIMKLDGNHLEFLKGGLMNITGISFEKGWEEEQGLITITTTTLFVKITCLYFLSDLSWIISKLK